MAIDMNKIHLRAIGYDFEPFYEYAKFFEDRLSDGQEQVSEEFKAAIKGIDRNDEYYEVTQDDFAERHQMIANDFTDNFRTFLLTQICSTVEYEFVGLCNKVKFLGGHSIALPNFGTDAIGKAKIFLEKASGVDFSLVNDEWDFMLMMRRIRNKVVHSKGIINPNLNDNETKALIQFSQKGDFLRLDSDLKDPNRAKVVITSPKTNILFLDNVMNLFNKIIPQINFSRTL